MFNHNASLCQDEKFVDLEADPEDVRNDLNELSDQVAAHQELAAEIKSYQRAFRVRSTPSYL